jgi:hypothetical protein
MWLLIILAVHTQDPKDVPGRVTLEFETQAECIAAQRTIDWQLKFPQFKVVSQCTRKS